MGRCDFLRTVPLRSGLARRNGVGRQESCGCADNERRGLRLKSANNAKGQASRCSFRDARQKW